MEQLQSRERGNLQEDLRWRRFFRFNQVVRSN